MIGCILDILVLKPDIENHDFRGIHENCGHEARVLLVPTKTEQGRVRLRAFIDYCRMVLVPAYLQRMIRPMQLAKHNSDGM